MVHIFVCVLYISTVPYIDSGKPPPELYPPPNSIRLLIPAHPKSIRPYDNDAVEKVSVDVSYIST